VVNILLNLFKSITKNLKFLLKKTFPLTFKQVNSKSNKKKNIFQAYEIIYFYVLKMFLKNLYIYIYILN